jgi:hypothetical protein
MGRYSHVVALNTFLLGLDLFSGRDGKWLIEGVDVLELESTGERPASIKARRFGIFDALYRSRMNAGQLSYRPCASGEERLKAGPRGSDFSW